jgi:hypothetical protein
LIKDIQARLQHYIGDRVNSREWLDELGSGIRAVIQSPWFAKYSFTKHCLMDCTLQQLTETTQELKSRKVYALIFSYIYRNYSPPEISKLIEHLKGTKRIHRDYFLKLDFRIALDRLFRARLDDLKQPPRALPELILMQEFEIIKHVFDLGLETTLFTNILD